MNAEDIAEEAYTKYVESEAIAGHAADIAGAQVAAADAVQAAIDSGVIDRADIDEAYRRMLARRAHEHITDRGKRLILRKAQGQLAFRDLLDGVIVPLGEGQVTVFGELSAVTLRIADQPRFANIVTIQEDYNAWRRGLHDPAMGVLLQHGGTIRNAVAHGWLV
jgi:hypothetical protein